MYKLSSFSSEHSPLFQAGALGLVTIKLNNSRLLSVYAYRIYYSDPQISTLFVTKIAACSDIHTYSTRGYKAIEAVNTKTSNKLSLTLKNVEGLCNLLMLLWLCKSFCRCWTVNGPITGAQCISWARPFMLSHGSNHVKEVLRSSAGAAGRIWIAGISIWGRIY